MGICIYLSKLKKNNLPSKICKKCHDGRDSDNSEGGEDWGEGMDLD